MIYMKVVKVAICISWQTKRSVCCETREKWCRKLVENVELYQNSAKAVAYFWATVSWKVSKQYQMLGKCILCWHFKPLTPFRCGCFDLIHCWWIEVAKILFWISWACRKYAFVNNSSLIPSNYLTHHTWFEKMRVWTGSWRWMLDLSVICYLFLPWEDSWLFRIKKISVWLGCYPLRVAVQLLGKEIVLVTSCLGSYLLRGWREAEHSEMSSWLSGKVNRWEGRVAEKNIFYFKSQSTCYFCIPVFVKYPFGHENRGVEEVFLMLILCLRATSCLLPFCKFSKRFLSLSQRQSLFQNLQTKEEYSRGFSPVRAAQTCRGHAWKW